MNSYFASLYNLDSNHGESERLAVMSLWRSGNSYFVLFIFIISFVAVLQEYLLQNSNSLFTDSGSFVATVERIEVCDFALIFHIDCGQAIDIMRDAVKSVCEHHSLREYEITNGLSPYELTRLVHIPNITHSTFVR